MHANLSLYSMISQRQRKRESSRLGSIGLADPGSNEGGAVVIRKPYLIFVADESSAVNAKTAFGLRDWAREDCLGQWRLSPAAIDLGLPNLRPEEAVKQGVRSLLIGVAPVGGSIPRRWHDPLREALVAGLDLVSGLHDRLCDVPGLREQACERGLELHDVRHPVVRYSVATGRRRPGKRLLTVGTDCALGKKYTALALTRAMKEGGLDCDFRATGQTGILIAGQGIAIDAIVADFVAGAAEALSPANRSHHWDVIEGQGSLFHPAYAGVTLGLLHGSQPDLIVLCHDPTRRHINEYPDYPLPSLGDAAQAYLRFGRRTNPNVQLVGVSLNTSKLNGSDRRNALDRAADELGVPAFDPLRDDLSVVVELIERRAA
jgi:D-glutamate N-acetyltransferase